MKIIVIPDEDLLEETSDALGYPTFKYNFGDYEILGTCEDCGHLSVCDRDYNHDAFCDQWKGKS